MELLLPLGTRSSTRTTRTQTSITSRVRASCDLLALLLLPWRRIPPGTPHPPPPLHTSTTTSFGPQEGVGVRWPLRASITTGP